MKDTVPWAGGTNMVSPPWGLDMEKALTRWRGTVGQRGGVMAVNAFRYATRWGINWAIDHPAELEQLRADRG